MTRVLSPMTLAYSILSGPVVWFVHFVVVYSLADFGCRANFTNLAFITPDTIRLLIIVVTVVAVVLVGAGGIFAYRGWTRGKLTSIGEHEHFLVVAAMLLSALFLFSILITTMPTFFLNVCDQAA